MNNLVTLVGRLVSNPTLEKKEEKNISCITLAIPRSYKNENGIYETDFIPVILNGSLAVNSCEYCLKGDVIGVRGRLQVDDEKLVVIAEKLTFLASRKDNE